MPKRVRDEDNIDDIDLFAAAATAFGGSAQKQKKKQQKSKKPKQSKRTTAVASSSSSSSSPSSLTAPNAKQLQNFSGDLVLKWVEEHCDKDADELSRHIIAYMNRFFIMITHNQGAAVYLEEYYGRELPQDATEFIEATCFTVRNKKSLLEAYERYPFKLNGKGTTPSRLWLSHPAARTAHRIDFDPRPLAATAAGENAQVFNLFRGLKVKRNSGGDANAAQPIIDHIVDIWCKGDIVCADYLMDWMAHLVQRPHVKMVVTPVLKGGQGAGKGIIVQLLSKVLGEEHYIQCTNLDSITGKFQEERCKTNLLTFLDECTFSGNKKESSILKGLLSEPMKRWEAKFLAPLRVKSFSNYIVASNYEQIVFVEEQDRRWFCLEVDSRFAGSQTPESKEHFKRILAVTPKDFGAFLYARNLSNFEPRNMPASRYMQHQKTINFDSIMTFVHRLLDVGRVCYQPTGAALPTKLFFSEDGPQAFAKEDVYNAYAQMCRTAAFKYKNTVVRAAFWKKVRSVIDVEDTKAGGVVQVVFPQFEECRTQFATYLCNADTWVWPQLPWARDNDGDDDDDDCDDYELTDRDRD